MLIKLNMYKVFSSKMDELDLQELWKHAQSPLFSIDPLSIPQLRSKVDSLSGFYDFRPLCLELALGHPFTVPAPSPKNLQLWMSSLSVSMSVTEIRLSENDLFVIIS